MELKSRKPLDAGTGSRGGVARTHRPGDAAHGSSGGTRRPSTEGLFLYSDVPPPV